MSLKEMSDTFDVLVASYLRNTEFGIQEPLSFDEYEKSVFLTKAQLQLVIGLYNGSYNGQSFETSEEIRRYLAPLVSQFEKDKTWDTANKISNDNYAFKLKEDVMFIIFESVDWDNKYTGCIPYKNIQVQPITHDEYHKVKDNPFRGANNHRVLRLDIDYNGETRPDTADTYFKDIQFVELVSKYPIAIYRYRYIRKPSPILLGDFSNEGVEISHRTYPITSSRDIEGSYIDSSLHERLVELAVQLALQSRNININKQG